jgi:hypothetical protein
LGAASGDAVGTSRGRTILRIRVTPRSSRPGVAAGEGHLAVRVSSAAEGGRATEEALRTLASTLGVARSRLALISGARSRRKTVAVEDIGAADLRKRLAERVGEPG